MPDAAKGDAPSPVFRRVAAPIPIRFLGTPEDRPENVAVKAIANRPGFGLSLARA